MAKADLMDSIVNLAKRRGFVFPSSEIYGGFRSTWDYGPLGVLLKRNVKDAWWRSMVQLRDDIVGLDAAILMAPKVWEASGHLETFTDPLVDCRNCQERFRADQFPESGACPNCGAKDSFTEARQFHLMFKTHVGPVEDDGAVAYLRPETAQGIFVNFQNVQTTTRKKPPFGIAQIGKSFRNEITPGNFIFRTPRVRTDGDGVLRPSRRQSAWYEYWCQERYRWYTDLGIPEEKLRLRPHEADELSHYSIGTSDVEFLYPWGWGELEGIAQRTDFDLAAALEVLGSGSQLLRPGERRALPAVRRRAGCGRRPRHAGVPAGGLRRRRSAEREGRHRQADRPSVRPAAGADQGGGPAVVAQRQARPGVRRGRDDVAPHLMIDVDTAGSIGRRYRRHDEVGTPLCVTIDFDTLDDQAVTIRDRDTMAQDRVPIDTLLPELEDRLGSYERRHVLRRLGVTPQPPATNCRLRTGNASPSWKRHASERASTKPSSRATASRSRAFAPRGTCSPIPSSATATTNGSSGRRRTAMRPRRRDDVEPSTTTSPSEAARAAHRLAQLMAPPPKKPAGPVPETGSPRRPDVR